MDLSPSKGVALALGSMQRAGEYAPAAKVMGKLFLTLQESDAPLAVTDEDGVPIVSAPPMNRRTIIAEDMVQLSLFGALRDRLFSLVNRICSKESK
jgi:hypothetical protein